MSEETLYKSVIYREAPQQGFVRLVAPSKPDAITAAQGLMALVVMSSNGDAAYKVIKEYKPGEVQDIYMEDSDDATSDYFDNTSTYIVIAGTQDAIDYVAGGGTGTVPSAGYYEMAFDTTDHTVKPVSGGSWKDMSTYVAPS